MTEYSGATTTANCETALDEIGRVVVGKRGALTLILTTVLAGGHVLIEDLPGLGKTLIARSIAESSATATSIRPDAEDRPGAATPDAFRRRILSTTVEVRNLKGSP